MRGDVLARDSCFILQTHHQHRVERIDGRHQKRLSVPIVASLRQRLQIVVPPAILLVTLPRVKKFGADLRGKLALMYLTLGSRNDRTESHEESSNDKLMKLLATASGCR